MRYINAFLRIALTVAIMNGMARVGFAYWSFYQFKDHAHQTAVFGGQTPTEVLQFAVLEKAHELFLPITPDQVTVNRHGPRTVIEAKYVQPVEYFPNQRYAIQFSFLVEGFTLAGMR